MQTAIDQPLVNGDKKKCSKCGEMKLRAEFHRDKNRRDGRYPQCGVCTSAQKKERYHRDVEKVRAQQRGRYRKNADKILAQQREYRQGNIEKRRARQGEYYRKNADKLSAKQREYNHRDEVRVRRSERCRRRYQENPATRFAALYRTRFYDTLKGRAKPRVKTLQLLGCSVDEALAHLELQFEPGMSWDNWSLHGWHIDHIRPLASFDLADPEQCAEAFHHSNLRPLWAKDNWRKGAKYEEAVA